MEKYLNKIRAYISGPMSGIPMKNKRMFDLGEVFLKTLDYGIVNPASKPTEVLHRAATRSEYLEYMREDIFDILFDVWWFPRWAKRLLVRKGGVHEIWLLPNWRKSKGANCEVYIGRFFDLNIIQFKEKELNGCQRPRSKK